LHPLSDTNIFCWREIFPLSDGSRHIFVHPDIPELVNLQDVKGQAKPYQMRQFLKLIERHSLRLEEDK